MTTYTTAFGSLSSYQKGGIDVIDDDPRRYAFSNVFEVGAAARPWEKVAIAKNFENVIEVIRAEGVSEWRTCAHDEFPLCLDGEVTVELIKLDKPLVAVGKEGSVALPGEPEGRPMGQIVLRRGHMALLPSNSAYRFRALSPSLLLLQTLAGDDTIERWAQICLS